MSKINKSRTRLETLSADEKLLAGVTQYLSTLPSLNVASQAMTPAQIVQMIQGRITTAKAVETATAVLAAAVKADRDGRTQTNGPVAWKRIVVDMYSESPETLAIFGVSAPKVATKTVASKAAAAAKGCEDARSESPEGHVCAGDPAWNDVAVQQVQHVVGSPVVRWFVCAGDGSKHPPSPARFQRSRRSARSRCPGRGHRCRVRARAPARARP